MNTLYGIKNCDTVKKAKKWLENQSLNYQFHDFRSDGLTASHIQTWASKIDVDKLVNRRSTTWKQLDDTQKALVTASTSKPGDKFTSLLLEHPTLLKRPILETADGRVFNGFNANTYNQIFSS